MYRDHSPHLEHRISVLRAENEALRALVGARSEDTERHADESPYDTVKATELLAGLEHENEQLRERLREQVEPAASLRVGTKVPSTISRWGFRVILVVFALYVAAALLLTCLGHMWPN